MAIDSFQPYGIDAVGRIDEVKQTRNGPQYTFHYDHAPERQFTASRAELDKIIGR